MRKPLLCIYMTIIVGAFLTNLARAAGSETPMYQWTDQRGIENWADKNPLTDPSKQPAREIDLQRERALPMLNVEKVMNYLKKVANDRVPAACRERNSDNPAQRSICEQFQYRALSKLEGYIKDPANTGSSFIYERCRGKWVTQKRVDFVSLAQCMGIKV